VAHSEPEEETFNAKYSMFAVEDGNVVVDENVDPNAPRLDGLERPGQRADASDEEWAPDEDSFGRMATEEDEDGTQNQFSARSDLLPEEQQRGRTQDKFQNARWKLSMEGLAVWFDKRTNCISTEYEQHTT
jgi:hypothetical protein